MEPRDASQMRGVTQDDISKLSKAMKDEQFRNHLDDYCKEISDPANRKEYLQYLDQLVAKGEMPEGQTLLRCQPGCCVKTSILFKSGQTQKCFINVVHTNQLDDLSIASSEKGGRINLPYSLGPPRPDRDHNDEYCLTCDLAVSTGTFMQAVQKAEILKMLVDTAAEGLASKFLQGHEDVKKDFKLMKRMRCKGVPVPLSVRADLLKNHDAAQIPSAAIKHDAVTPSELRQMRKEAKQQVEAGKSMPSTDVSLPQPAVQGAVSSAQHSAPKIRVPKHSLIHSGNIDLADFMEANHIPQNVSQIPRLLKLIVELPTVKRVQEISLEVTKTNVVVEVPNKYYLDLPLPYEIQETDGTAKYDKAKQMLTLELPVIPQCPDPDQVQKSTLGADSANHGDQGELQDDDDGSEDELPERPSSVEAQKSKQAETGPDSKMSQAACAEMDSAPQEASATRLELDPQESILHVVASSGSCTDATNTSHEAFTYKSEQCPEFEECSSFQGSRPGYYFCMGDKGLGYYLDRRQAQPKQHTEAFKAHDLTFNVNPVVDVCDAIPTSGQELETKSHHSCRTMTEKHPQALQDYVRSTSQLVSRIASSEPQHAAISVSDDDVEVSQNRHNVCVSIALPPCCQVADVQLVLVGRNLTVRFCCCPIQSQNAASTTCCAWSQYVFCRVLCGAVDPRQWHTDILRGASLQLVVVVRKVDQSKIWPSVLDNTAQAQVDVTSVLAQLPEASQDPIIDGVPNPDSNDLHDADIVAHHKSQSDTDKPAKSISCLIAEDSSELDATVPVVHKSATGDAASVLQNAASAAMVQSATVMGQAVILRNRLMYQLL